METEYQEQEDYEVRIGAFNGPMDLLVYLVQKKEVPLEQISIAEIADQFLKWVNAFGNIDLSKAGDFLSMASRLMALKVQELLPAEERDPELEAEYNEDREKLMQEMLEYQRYKQVASGLQNMEGENFGTYSRGRMEKTQNEDDTLADANIWQLFRAYQKSLKTKVGETVHHIELDYVTIQDRQQAINNYLAVHGRALFEDLLDNDSHPIVAAVTFMALLEMIKTDELVFRQSELFGPIWIYRKKNNSEYAEEMANETVFFSKDPEVKSGLVEAIRNQAIARSKAQSVGDIAAVMREAVLWTERGRNVTDEDLVAMLEGREDISEVDENPFAQMMREDEDAEKAMAGASETPPVENASEPPAETPSEVTDADRVGVKDENGIEDLSSNKNEIEQNSEEEKIEEISEENSVESNIGENSSENLSTPSAHQQMSDEEFAEFMRKAQSYYNGTAESTATTESTVDEAEPASSSTSRISEEVSTYKEKEEPSPSSSSYYAGNEMTDEEYIAFLNRSVKDK